MPGKHSVRVISLAKIRKKQEMTQRVNSMDAAYARLEHTGNQTTARNRLTGLQKRIKEAAQGRAEAKRKHQQAKFKEDTLGLPPEATDAGAWMEMHERAKDREYLLRVTAKRYRARANKEKDKRA